MAQQYVAQINRLPCDPSLKAVLQYLCSESNKLYNCTVYLARQLYFKSKPNKRQLTLAQITNGQRLSTLMKDNIHMKSVFNSSAQQTCISVGESFKSYRALEKLWKTGQLPDEPKLPKYRKSGGMYQVIYPKRWLKLTNNQVRVPLGRYCKVWFGLPEIYIPFPSNLNWDSIRELQIVPRADYFDAVWISKSAQQSALDLDQSHALAIDHGIDNWLTCASTMGHSFIIDGRHLKSLNQWYNKRVSILKESKPHGSWSKLLDRVTTKRNRQMRDAVNKAARLVIQYCLDHKIGTVVFGWNKGQKQSVNLGKKNNQKFVQIPTARLKRRVMELCELYGILFIEQEESYTSKASALDLDVIPVYGEKPECWKPSGRRITRGLYKAANGEVINADCNGAYNIGRKANVPGMQCKPARGALTSPQRMRLWLLPQYHDR
jgi:IS605 OrfB family transposase